MTCDYHRARTRAFGLRPFDRFKAFSNKIHDIFNLSSLLHPEVHGELPQQADNYRTILLEYTSTEVLVGGIPPLPGTRLTGSPEAARDGKRGAPCNNLLTSIVEHNGLATRSCLSLPSPTTPTISLIDYLALLNAFGFGLPLFDIRVDNLKQSFVTFVASFIVSCFACVSLIVPTRRRRLCLPPLAPMILFAAPPLPLWLTTRPTKIRWRDTGGPLRRAADDVRAPQRRRFPLRRPHGREDACAPRHQDPRT